MGGMVELNGNHRHVAKNFLRCHGDSLPLHARRNSPCRGADLAARQHLPHRALAAVLCGARSRLLRQARLEGRARIHRKLGAPARRARRRHRRHRAFGRRQRGGHDRRRQGRHRDRLRRRQRHQRVLRPGHDQGFFRHPRQGHRRRCHQHRLCAAGQENFRPARAAGRHRLFAQSGRQRPAAPQSPVRRQEQCRRHPQPALLAASRGQRHAQPRPHHRHARPLSGRRRLRAPRLGARQCGDAGKLSRRLRRGAALVARSEQPRRGRGHSGRQAEAAAG